MKIPNFPVVQDRCEAAKTIKKQGEGMLNWFNSLIIIGIFEDFNSLIQAAKAKPEDSERTVIESPCPPLLWENLISGYPHRIARSPKIIDAL